MIPIELLQYEDQRGRSPFGKWFAALDDQTAARISRNLERLVAGNTSNLKGVGGGVTELRIDFGPGYRVYFGRDGDTVIILLAGGTKKRQQQDILDAQIRWSEYKRRKQG